MPAGSLLTFLALVRLTTACQDQGVSTIVPHPRTNARPGPSYRTETLDLCGAAELKCKSLLGLIYESIFISFIAGVCRAPCRDEMTVCV